MTETVYLNIDAILAEEEHVQCEIQLDAFHLESLEYHFLTYFHLDKDDVSKNSDDQEIQQEEPNQPQKFTGTLLASTKFKCSLWLAQALASFKFVTFQIPKWFEQQFLDVALSGPTVINLRDKNYHFFLFGGMLANRIRNLDILSQLKEIFLQRTKEILLILLHASEQAPIDLLKKLTNLENLYYENGRDIMLEYNQWSTSKNLIQKKEQVITGRKKLKQV